MKPVFIVIVLTLLTLTSCVDDGRYYDQGKEDAWKGDKNSVLYLFNKNYRSGYDEAIVRIDQASEMSQSVKKAGNELSEVAKDMGRSISEFWKDMTE